MNKLLLNVAVLAHENWKHWMEYQNSCCKDNIIGEWTMPSTKVERWQRQASTPYSQLSESEKNSDRELALKWIENVNKTDFKNCKIELILKQLNNNKSAFEFLAHLEHKYWAEWINYEFNIFTKQPLSSMVIEKTEIDCFNKISNNKFEALPSGYKKMFVRDAKQWLKELYKYCKSIEQIDIKNI